MVTTAILWALVLLIIAFVYYSRFVEPGRLRVTHRRISIPRLPANLEGLKIVHLADLHIKGEGKPFALQMARRAVAMTLAEEPDLVCVTGDVGQASRFIPVAAEALRPLADRPVWLVMGNHDHDKMLESEYAGPPAQRVEAEQWRATAQRAGLRVLLNEHASCQVRGVPVVIAGTGDASCGWDDLPAALSGEPHGALQLLLSHSPDIVDDPQSDWADLVLCGHTHGGQARLPWLGTPWAPVWRDRRRSEGLWRVGQALCFVSRGVGAGVRARFLCPPEVVVLTLTAGAGDAVRPLPRYSTLTTPVPAPRPALRDEQQEA